MGFFISGDRQLTTDTTSTQQAADTSTTDKTTTQQTTQDDAAKAATTAAAAASTSATTPDKWSMKWGETWREDAAKEYATDDKGALDQKAYDKTLARFKRIATPKGVFDWAFNAEKKISDGSYKKPLGDKATAEEITEYRKANGIPEAPEKYLEALPNGLVIGEDDKPIMDSFAKALHGVHADPKTVHAAVDWYYKFQDEQEGLRQEANAAAKTATEDALRDEWGPDFRPNTNLINNLVGTMPKELQEELFQSATPAGTQIMNNPAMLKWLAQQARELNYTGTVLPSGEATSKGLTTELDALKAKMGDRSSDYWKGPQAEKNQSRYRELLDLKQRIDQRAA